MGNAYAVNYTISQQLKADLCLFISFTISQAHSILCTPTEGNLYGILIARCLALPLFSGFNHCAMCMPSQSCAMKSNIFLSHTAYPCHQPRYRLTMNIEWTNKDRLSLFISIYISVFIFFLEDTRHWVVIGIIMTPGHHSRAQLGHRASQVSMVDYTWQDIVRS